MSKKIDDVARVYAAQSVAWDGERAARAFDGAVRGHAKLRARKQWLRTAATTVASVAAFAALVHGTTQRASGSLPSRALSPEPSRSECVAFADGSPDGGYEASVR